MNHLPVGLPPKHTQTSFFEDEQHTFKLNLSNLMYVMFSQLFKRTIKLGVIEEIPGQVGTM